MSEVIENHAISKLCNVDQCNHTKFETSKEQEQKRSKNLCMYVVFHVYQCHLQCIVM